jgi:hypothetical protein
MRAVIRRHHDDTSGTGALDSNADGNAFTYTATNLAGRIQITAMWYDDLDGVTEAVAYGTNGGSDFDRKPSGGPGVRGWAGCAQGAPARAERG